MESIGSVKIKLKQKRANYMQTKNRSAAIQITGRHVELTEALRQYVQRKVAALHLDYPKIVAAQVVLDVEKYRHIAEVILYCTNHITIKASVENDDMYASIDQAIDRVSRQMRKCHTRLLRRHRLRKQTSPSQTRSYAGLFEEGYHDSTQGVA